MGRKLVFALVLAAAALLLAACGPGATPTPMVIRETVEVPVTPEGPGIEVPFVELWQSSGHADDSAEAFNHWNEDDPAEIPTSCAKCHSTPGYHDFLGLDGSEFGTVDEAAPIGSTVECVACHNDVTLDMTSVVMPSGVELTDLGDESRCMQCHQGRSSTFDVTSAIEEAGVGLDEVSEDLGFINIHYYAAAATKYGTIAKGGYEYEGQRYDANFAHVAEQDTCIECHNMHTLEVRVNECSTCHADVSEVEDVRDIRMQGSLVDYDGDGDLQEGIFYEIQGMQEKLYTAIQRYGTEVAGTAIVYDDAAYPYFFIDSDENGEISEDEASYPNQYNAWTPRLVRAAYNYQVSQKDPGTFAHGGKYIIQLLWDSTADLNQVISEPIPLEDTHGHSHRIDMGHFAGSEEAFRHWDEDGEVPASCSRCHSAEGLPLFLEEGVTISQEPSNGFQCRTCHNDLDTFSRFEVTEVTFPSGATVDSGDPDMNLCMTCHQGRSSTGDVRSAVEGLPADQSSDQIRFVNIHYFAAGATLFGGEVEGAYEYEGQEYLGRFEHVQNFNSCTSCHSAHQLQVKFEACSACHGEVETYTDLQEIRMSTVDFDGDGDSSEGLAGEIQTMQETLYAAIQDYASTTLNAPIVYDSHSYPYFFADDGNGVVDEGEANYGNRYQSWSPTLLKAAYNYQYAQKDPGAFAHNGQYIIQVLYDSLQDIGGDVSGMTRP
ncbi:MAG: cytochrome c3 family protein [Anaerolineales bacterium]|nr:cytochrome c3 family protein [Anaerolineales bacterium]